MEKYELKIFPSAEQDLKDITDYLNELSPEAALKMYDEIVDSIASLERMPMRCPLSKKNIVLRAKEYRMLIVNNYVVFYVVSGNIVQIRRILFGRRRYEFLL